MKLNDYLVNENGLKKYGFKKNESNWTFESTFESMKIVFSLDNEFSDLTVDVFDQETNEKFLPFYSQQKSEYTANITKQVEKIKDEILSKCFTKNNLKEDLFNWCMKQWPNTELNKWEKFPDYVALKDKTTKKWYALFMNVKLSSLDKQQFKSKQEVWVVNLKLDDEVNKLLDHKEFFPAFHQSKKNWISMLLNSKTDITKAKELIEQSYKIATK